MCFIHEFCSIILETDANVIAGKVASNSIDAGAPLSEQVVSDYGFSANLLSPKLCG